MGMVDSKALDPAGLQRLAERIAAMQKSAESQGDDAGRSKETKR